MDFTFFTHAEYTHEGWAVFWTGGKFKDEGIKLHKSDGWKRSYTKCFCKV